MKKEKWLSTETKEEIITFINDSLEQNDYQLFFRIIGHLARMKGMSKIAKELNLNREGLYTALSMQGNPSFITAARVMDNLGFSFEVKIKTE